ncbi:hypothetical protein [Plantactinospora sp. GCM10030261]|uniref:hypothetical protein n=1 Tax=Plantactinospora sp. GCM10030261 TaxID=3273420 RepID=UPI003609BB34
MDYRDWGSADRTRRSGYSGALPDEGPGDVDEAGYPAPRSRAARRRLGADSAQRYVPDWAREDPPVSTGGGRHRYAEEEEPASRSAGRRARWESTETTASWQRATETDGWSADPPALAREPESSEWASLSARSSYRQPERGEWAALSARPADVPRPNPEPVSGGWSLGAHQDERPARHAAGGRRRAREDDDGGAVHRRVATGYGEADPQPVTDVGPSGSTHGRRRNRAAEADNWENRPAVDPWEQVPPSDPWARPDDTSVGAWRWDGGSDSTTETGQWGRLSDETREWTREPETEEPTEGNRRYGRRETFWSGTRLAGDDPRWMDTPAAAPRSPVVEYSESSPWSAPGTARRADRRGTTTGAGRRTGGAERRGAPRRSGSTEADRRGGSERRTAARSSTRRSDPGSATRRADTGTAVRRAPVAAPRRPGTVPDRRRSSTVVDRAAIRRLERDLVERERGGLPAALFSTVAWYVAPLLVLFGWLLTVDGRAPTGCVTDVSGGGCESPRAEALASVLGGTPQFGAALLASLLIAIVLRRAGGNWRAATVGLVAAVVGGGLSTVLFSAMSDGPVG